MPDSLDVAVQRKRIEELQRHGQSTQEAEARLRAMLEAVTWRSQAVDPMLHFKKGACTISDFAKRRGARGANQHRIQLLSDQ